MSDTFFSTGTANGLHTTNWVGAIVSTPGNITYNINGKIITINLPAIFDTATATATINATVNLPASLRPASTQHFTLIVQNTLFAAGELEINAGDGSMSIFADLNNASFGTGLAVGFHGISFTYTL